MTGRIADPPPLPQPPPPSGVQAPALASSSALPAPAARQGGLVLAFEGARGLAAMLVALFHLGLGEPAVLSIRAGYLFVDLFFVLSGFLICASYAGKLDRPSALPTFLVRRTGRLLPLLLVATLAYLLMLNAGVLVHRLLDGTGAGAAAGAAHPWMRPRLTELLATLTMTHSLGLFDHVILNYAAWSISTEFYAYLAFAALCLLLRGRARWLGFAALSAAAYLVSIWASVRVHGCLRWGGCMDLTFDYGYWRCLAGFFLGASLSHLRMGRPAPALLALGQGASVIALLAMFLLSRRTPAVALAAPLLFACLLLSIRSDTGPLARLLGTAPLQMLGRYSYSIYLMHPVILLAWNAQRAHAVGWLGRGLFIAGYVALVLAVSGRTFRWVEDPMRRRFNRFAARRFETRAATEVSAAGAQ
jgi:peptidoglycan/LPS O-acetylase OafA/YrhL